MERMEMYAKEALPFQGREGQQVQPAYKLATLVAWVEELPPLDDLKPIEQQRQRIIAYWRAVPYEERDRQFLKECFYQYQADIVLMLDSLFSRSAEALSKVLKKVLAALMACLEALLEFIERHRPQYFNTGQRLPECIRMRRLLELEAEREGAQVLLPLGCTYAQLRASKDITAEDMRFIEELPEEMTPAESAVMNRYLRIWSGFKLHIHISVALFGLLLGTLIKVKVFEPDERERDVMMKFFAQHLRTDKSSNISFKSLGNHRFYRRTPAGQNDKAL